jgi:hypothetical protein
MHLIIGLFILIGIATFVVFAFWQGMGVPRSGREDYGPSVGSDGGSGHSADGRFGHGSQSSRIRVPCHKVLEAIATSRRARSSAG